MVNAFFGGLASGAAQGLTNFLDEERKRTSDIVNRAADYQMRTNLSRREKRQQDIENYKNAFNEMTALTGSELLSASLLKKSNNNITQARLMAERLNKTAQVLGQTPLEYVELTEDPNITVDIDSIAGSLAEPFKPMKITAKDLAGIPDWQRRSAEKMLGRANKDIIQPEEEQVSFDFDNIPDIDDSFLKFNADTNYLQRGRVYADLAIQFKDSDPKKANEYAAKSREALNVYETGQEIKQTNKYSMSRQSQDSDRFAQSIATITGQQDKIIPTQFGIAYQSDKQAADLRVLGLKTTQIVAAAVGKGMRYEDVNVEIAEIISTGYMPVLRTTDEGGVSIEQGKDLFEMFGIKRPDDNPAITTTQPDTSSTQTNTQTTQLPEGESDIKGYIDTITDVTSSQTQINGAVEALAELTGKTEDQIRREYNLN